MTKKAYLSNLSDAEWQLLEFLSLTGCSRLSKSNAIFYLLSKGCYWQTLYRKVVKRFRHETVYTKGQILGLLNDHRDYLRQPLNQFTLQGYEIIQDFLDKDECSRLIQVANRYLHSESYLISRNSYLVCRKELQVMDMQVQQIFNAQELDEKLSHLFHSRIIEEMFERQIGERLQLQSITIQVDNLDTKTKRGFHSDKVTPPVYKAFIYLNDVIDYGDGPYTVIPGSHRHTVRKILNYLYCWVITSLSKRNSGWKIDDRRLFYSDKQSVSIFEKAGTLIISNQQIAHKGWQKHDINKRYALVCYLIAEKHYDGQPFKWWQAAIEQKLQVNPPSVLT